MKKLILVLGFIFYVPINANAQISGSCAPVDGKGNAIGSCSYQLENGVLTFSGNGPMQSWNYNTTPWYDMRNTITEVKINDGITNIGKYALFQTNITNLTLPDSVTEIGSYAFEYTYKLENVSLSNNLQRIGTDAFSSNISSIVLPESLFETNNSYLNEYAFNTNKKPITIYCPKDSEACLNYQPQKRTHNGQGGYNYFDIPYSIETYERYGDAILYNGKFYTNPGDIGTPNYIKKRIYTIDEANKVSGRKNSIKIRYK